MKTWRLPCKSKYWGFAKSVTRFQHITISLGVAYMSVISAGVLLCIALECSSIIDRDLVRRFFVAFSLVLVFDASYIGSNGAFTQETDV